MPANAVKPTVLKELQRQFNQELGASHAYVALAVWCEHENLNGFARFFSKQAHEERVHAQKIMSHLLDRGVLPTLASLPAPTTEFTNLMDIAKRAQAMEQTNTAGINACYEAAAKDNDYPAQVLLHWFINEQVEEENWADEMVDRVQRSNCAGGISELDRHIERYLLEEEASNAAADA